MDLVKEKKLEESIQELCQKIDDGDRTAEKQLEKLLTDFQEINRQKDILLASLDDPDAFNDIGSTEKEVLNEISRLYSNNKELVYDCALEEESKGHIKNAIWLYYLAAVLGNRKAINTLSNMGGVETEYFYDMNFLSEKNNLFENETDDDKEEKKSGIYNYNLWEKYTNGTDFEEGEGKAVYYLIQSALEGYEPAEYELAKRYYDVVEKADDICSAMKKELDNIIKNMDFENNSLSKVSFDFNLSDNNEHGCFKWYKKAGEQGNKDAGFALGLLYFFGIDTEKNYPEAEKWFKTASEDKCYKANLFMGIIQYTVNKDYVKAKEYLFKSVQHEDPLALLLASILEMREKSYTSAIDVLNKAGETAVVEQFLIGVCRYYECNYKEAEEILGKAAEQDIPSALMLLGVIYYKGLLGEKNFKRAVKLLMNAVEQGNEAAMDYLDDCYKNGKGEQADCEKIVELFKKAYKNKDSDAQYALGTCYKNGDGVEKDSKEKIKWYRKAAENGNIEAQYHLARSYYYEEAWYEALKWYLEAAKNGHTRSQYILAFSYEDGGELVRKDMEQALYWYSEAAENGDAESQYRLAEYCFSGWGSEGELKEGYKWYRKAAENNHGKAQRELASCYQSGSGVEKNYEKALEWYRKAAENGDSFVKFGILSLAKDLLNGEKDTKLLNNVGDILYYGEIVEKDYAIAFKLYLKAADLGDDKAQYSVGYMYLFGEGTEESISEAIKYLQLSAEQGNPNALYTLGYIYLNGEGIKTDIKKAKKYLTAAKTKGHSLADELLQKIK